VARIRADEKRRERRDERKHSRTRRLKDSTWSKKGSRSYFGHNLHTAQGKDIPLIKEFIVTTGCSHG
jgi:IS5 family transposase